MLPTSCSQCDTRLDETKDSQPYQDSIYVHWKCWKCEHSFTELGSLRHLGDDWNNTWLRTDVMSQNIVYQEGGLP